MATAGSDEKHPTHHVTLSDGSTTIGLMLANHDGKDNPLRLSRSAYPRQSTKISSGESKYDDTMPPYKPIAQDEFSGGRGAEVFEDDKTRYYDGNVDTGHSNQVILNSLAQFATGISSPTKGLGNWMNATNKWVKWLDLKNGATYYADSFVPQISTMSGDYVYLWLWKVGTPGTLTVHIYNDNAGSPGTSQCSATVTAPYVPEGFPVLHKFGVSFPANFTQGATYWVVVHTTDNSQTDYWRTQYNTGDSSGGKYSGNGTSWSTTSGRYFWVLDKHGEFGSGWFFEYKRCMYFLSRLYNDNRLFRNGDTGAADSNSGDLSKLNDATKSWTTNEWAGCIALIIEGPGSEEDQPWREIQSNTATALQVSPPWITTHTTATSYVILGSNKWSNLTSFVACQSSDVEVAGDFFFIAMGDMDSDPVRICRFFNNNGTWTELYGDDDTLEAVYLKAIQSPGEGMMLYGAMNNHPTLGKAVWHGKVPPTVVHASNHKYNVYKTLGILADAEKPWTDQVYANITQRRDTSKGGLQWDIGSGFTTGIFAAKELDAALDITAATHIGLYIMSSVATTSLKLLLDDNSIVEGKFLPSLVMHRAKYAPTNQIIWKDTSATKWFPQPNMHDRWSFYVGLLDLASDDYLYIGCDDRFYDLRVEMGSTVNDVVATLTVSLWNGSSWLDVAITDGTLVSGKTLAQDGDITVNSSPISRWQAGSDDSTNLDVNMYWMRLKPSANLTGGILIEAILPINTHRVESWTEVNLSKIADGDTATFERLWLRQGDLLYVLGENKYNNINVDISAAANTVTATMSAWYWNGNNWQSLTITDGTSLSGKTLGQDGVISFTIPADWQQITIGNYQGYPIKLQPSTTLYDSTEITAITLANNNATALTIPSLSANLPTYTQLAITPGENPDPDYTQIKGIALRQDTDQGAQSVYLLAPIEYIRVGDNIDHTKIGDDQARINGLEAYGEERKNCWVFKEDSVWEIQSENDYVPVPLPLQELSNLRSEDNGTAHCANDVYLYFNLGQHIERYYNRNLDDVGPNRDEGLPSNRQGIPRKMLSLPGAVVTAIDTRKVTTKYSSILSRATGWHEVYRSPIGDSISDIEFQVLPGDLPSRLWFVQGYCDIGYLLYPKVSKNPVKDPGYLYTSGGYLITTWITASLLDLQKLFASLKLYTENLASGTYPIEVDVDYQLESGSDTSGWTSITDIFDTSPFQEISLKSTNDVKARRLRLRFVFTTTDITVTPILKAYVLEALMRFQVKNVYALTIRVRDDEIDMLGRSDEATRAETIINQLDTWGDSPTALTLRNPFSPYDNMTVILEPPGFRPISVDVENGIEVHTGEITLLEL